jgi:2-haloacid dehalogenase
MIVLGFDVYGTLVDRFGMEQQLATLVGDRGSAICALWRQKQLEYSFRRGLMRCYEDFDACTRRALSFAAKTHNVDLSEAAQRQLLTDNLNLPAFPDVPPAFETLKASGCRLLLSRTASRTACARCSEMLACWPILRWWSA